MTKKYAVFLTALFCAFIGGFLVLQLALPDRDFSPQENRYLSQLPVPVPDDFTLSWPIRDSGDFFTGKLMGEFETYVTDQFPGRDGWISAKAAGEFALGKRENNGVYLCAKDTLIPRFDRPDQERVTNNLNYVNKLVDNVDNSVYFGLIPGKVSLWSDRLPDGAPNADESAMIAGAAASTQANWVDITTSLADHAAEDIYYRLDHHWTSLGAYYGYEAIARAMGFTPVPLEAYEKTTVSTDFNGTTYSSSGVRWMPPDAIDVYVPETGITVKSWRGLTPEAGVLYDWSKLEEKDKYAFFLGGNQSLAVLKTEHTDAPKLLIVRDSYTDSLAPFLTPHFSEIHLFDPRYNKTPLTQYIAENHIDDVLVLYSANNFATDTNLFVLGK